MMKQAFLLRGSLSISKPVVISVTLVGLLTISQQDWGLVLSKVRHLLKRSAFKANVILLGSLRAKKMTEEQQATKKSSTHKRTKQRKGSQTDNEDYNIEYCRHCTNMADSLTDINSNFDKALSCIREVEELKQTQENLEKRTSS